VSPTQAAGMTCLRVMAALLVLSSAGLAGYARFYSRSHDAIIRAYDDAGNVIETHGHIGDFKEW
jgi:hypothetical protein